jgi:hypothetical protein
MTWMESPSRWAAVLLALAAAACGGASPESPQPAAHQGVVVTLDPKNISIEPAGVATFTASVTGTIDLRVTWSSPDAGGVDASGKYQAPTTPGSYRVVATSVADPSKSGTGYAVVSAPGSIDPKAVMPTDRTTVWNPGLNAVGGIPSRTTICATVQASSYGNGTQDATSAIQNAVNACPAGQVVQLSAGTFLVNGYVQIAKGITLRGAGATQTTLTQTTGADVDPSRVGSTPTWVQQPIILVGPNRWPSNGTSTNLTADAVKGTFSVTVASTAGLAVGDFVEIDELIDNNLIYYHPNDIAAGGTCWFMRCNRPLAEWKEISALSGNTVTFNTPFHQGYRVAQTAQLTPMAAGSKHVKYAGVEDLKVRGGGEGNISIVGAAYSWVKGVDSSYWAVDPSIRIQRGFRIELRDSFLHDGEWPYPGGAGYAMSFESGTAESLMENNISMTTLPPATNTGNVVGVNKVMVFRAAGAGCVVAYNYVDNGIVGYDFGWQEVGVNGSHMCGNHHALFEGNWGFNADGDNTHGNQIFHTFFRNQLTGRRTLYDTSPDRAIGMMAGNWWMSAVGNVLGYPGMSAPYEDHAPPWSSAVYKLGYNPEDWNATADQKVLDTFFRNGNFDYVTNGVLWDPTYGPATIPSSLYRTTKPAFFGTLTWPWVDPTGTTKVYTLPAKARWDAGTPFTQP